MFLRELGRSRRTDRNTRMHLHRTRWLFALLLATCFFAALPIRAQDENDQAWLRYAPPPHADLRAEYAQMPGAVVSLDSSEVAISAREEMLRGVRSMLQRSLRVETTIPDYDAWILGTSDELQRAFSGYQAPAIGPEGFALATYSANGHTYWLIDGADLRGILYGAFHLLLGMGEGRTFASMQGLDSPAAPIRWTNEWDNLDGTIERGYGGRSIFFDDGGVRSDLTRAGDYARLLASLGINGCTVNNVNADPRFLQPTMIRQLARIADAFRPWGVRLSLAVNLSSPQMIGGLDTFNPNDPKVAAWWRTKVEKIYAAIPDFGGFVVKADSEGEPGPSKYGATPAAAANLLADALKPHGGVLMYRAFVYNHHLNWHDMKADRARAAYDIFHPLDGQFASNVVIQIKNGPIDFQVREPVSPLFAGLHQTNVAVELEVAQEYMGQQQQLVYLPTQWQHYLDFNLHVDNRSTPLSEIVTGKTFHRPLGGFVGVTGVGMDQNWLGSDLALANLYGFGRLAWNPNTSAETIARDWTRLYFNDNPTVVSTLDQMLMSSWRIYEHYTGPLGLQTLTNITGSHYGPAPQSQENNGWGQWIRATHTGVGMDRTTATGTGFIGQYPPEVAKMYESLETCPDNLLLFMHHVPYTYRLRDGQTVIQEIYNLHYQGAPEAAGLVRQWQTLRGLIPPQPYEATLHMLDYQAGEAMEWRDAITRWFYKMSSIPDDLGRVDHYPDRVIASQMQLDGYTPVDVHPWESASGGKAYVCEGRAECTASTRFARAAGWYTVAVQYFDYRNGVSRFDLMLNHQTLATWRADMSLPGDAPSGDTSVRYTLHGVPLLPGDVLTVQGHPNGGEPAAIDYISIIPESQEKP
jgi:alpha-glucuronidase